MAKVVLTKFKKWKEEPAAFRLFHPLMENGVKAYVFVLEHTAVPGEPSYFLEWPRIYGELKFTTDFIDFADFVNGKGFGLYIARFCKTEIEDATLKEHGNLVQRSLRYRGISSNILFVKQL